MSKNTINILVLAGIFFGSIAVFFGIGSGVKALINKPARENNIGGNDIIVLPDPGRDDSKPKKVIAPVVESASAVFDRIGRKYSVSPQLKQGEAVFAGIVYELYDNEALSGVPVYTSTPQYPDKILNVKQSVNPYYLVAKDTLQNVSSLPYEIVCKPHKISANKLAEAINSMTYEQFKKTEYQSAIDLNCVFIQDGSKRPETGINGILPIIRHIKDGEFSGITITHLNPGTEKNDFKVTEITYVTNQ